MVMPNCDDYNKPMYINNVQRAAEDILAKLGRLEPHYFGHLG